MFQIPEFWTSALIAALAVVAACSFLYVAIVWVYAARQQRDGLQTPVVNPRSATPSLRGTDTAHDEFIASHQPKFIVHSVKLLDSQTEGGPGTLPLRASFVIVNGGTNNGTITNSGTFLEYWDPKETPWRGRPQYNNIPRRGRYLVGAAETVEIEADKLSNAVHTSREPTGKILYFYGWLLYGDDKGSKQSTRFCSFYDKTRGRFIPVADPEANQTT
jgi:hypothetical protein